ncbi:MAG: hypothetical protein IPM71_16015 [Bacteroidota bacterium]|nr:MAG: hypothetical protein IPM71_16015 [Bacteroidota bacterium]
MIIYLILGLFILTAYFIYKDKKERKDLMNETKKFIDKNYDKLVNLDLSATKFDYLPLKTNIYYLKKGDSYLICINQKKPDIQLSDLIYSKHQRFTQYLTKHNEPMVFQDKRTNHLFYPVNSNDINSTLTDLQF